MHRQGLNKSNNLESFHPTAALTIRSFKNTEISNDFRVFKISELKYIYMQNNNLGSILWGISGSVLALNHGVSREFFIIVLASVY